MLTGPAVEVVVDWRVELVHDHGRQTLQDVKYGILGGSGSHHLPLVTHIIRYCNHRVVYDIS
jgi:hypothetical protein